MKRNLTSKMIMLALMLCLVFSMAAPVSAASKLSKPTNVKATLSAKYTSKISWNKVKNAKSYEVYYSVNGAKYKKLATTKKATVTQKKLAAGKTYSYKVRAINGKQKSTYSTVKTLKTIGSTSPKLVVTAYNNVDDANKAKLKWNKVKNATGYYVYKKSEDNYELVKKTTALIYKDPDGELGTKYTYKVVPYIKANGKIYKGTSSIKSVTTRTSGYLMELMPPYKVDGSWGYYTEEFFMGGLKYGNGFNVEVEDEAKVYFNLEGKYDTISFITGVLDSDDYSDDYPEKAEVSIYCDGDLSDSFLIDEDMLPTKHTINVSDCMQLKITIKYSGDGYETYGFADIIATI